MSGAAHRQRWEQPWEPVADPTAGGGAASGGPAVPLESVAPGELIANDAGEFHLVSGRHDISLAGIDTWPDPAAREGLIVAANADDLRDFSLGEALFIDTETTGLAGGTGTYAFMVGCGWLEAGALRVDQLFMRDQADEPALLRHLDELLHKFTWLVSFNGAAFDLPLLRTRFIMNRRRSGLDALGSLDLLQVARRLWKYRLADRSLGALEEALLNVTRPVDVPSYLIPGIYFQYVRSGDARMLGPVFAHNRQDIVSMLLLLEQAVATATRWPGGDVPAEDALGMARAYALRGDDRTAAEAYARALALGLGEEHEVLARTHLSLRFKRQAAWPDAADIWSAMAGASGRAALWALVELAKYHEHQVGAFDAALACTDRALRQAESVRDSLPLQLAPAELLHRRRRLERRLQVASVRSG